MKKLDRIYLEASQLFARNGYEGVSMRDVADASGITLATLYYHFSSKEELHDEITQHRFEEFLGDLAKRHQAMTPEEDRPSVLLRNLFDAVLVDQTFFNLMQHDLHYFEDDQRRQRTRKRTAAFIGLIRQTLEKHWQHPAEETQVLALAAVITGYCELVQADDRFQGPEREAFVQQHRQTLVDLVQRQFDRPAA